MMPRKTRCTVCAPGHHVRLKHRPRPCEVCQELICKWSDRDHVLRHKYPKAPETVGFYIGTTHVIVAAFSRMGDIVSTFADIESVFTVNTEEGLLCSVGEDEPAIAYVDRTLFIVENQAYVDSDSDSE